MGFRIKRVRPGEACYARHDDIFTDVRTDAYVKVNVMIFTHKHDEKHGIDMCFCLFPDGQVWWVKEISFCDDN